MIDALLALAAPEDELGALVDLEVSGLGLVLVLLVAFVLFAVMGGVRWLALSLPMTKARRAALHRMRPVVETLVAVIYLLIAIPIVFRSHENYTPLVLAVLLFGMIGISWFAIRDFINGMFIKAGELCRIGDRVEIEGQSGLVKRLGYRVLTLESDAGDEIFIPYGRLSRRSILRTPRREGLHRHSFELELAAEADPIEVMAEIKSLAMSSHWSALVREPELEALAGGRLRVHVFALERERGGAIEALVRRGLAEN